GTLDRHGFPVLPPGESAGCIVPDPEKFPDGMKAFGSTLKQRGFQFGMYTSGEKAICDSDPKLRGFYASTALYGLRQTDAKCFADWGIDLLKIDMCNAPTLAYSYSSQVMHAWRNLLPSHIIIYNCHYGCVAVVNCGRPATGGNIYACPYAVNFAKNHFIQPYC